MYNMNLAAMPVSDMLDVMHHLFEEDNAYTSEAHMESKLKMREVLYESLYGEKFKYKYTKKTSNTDRPYVPPSASQDFGDYGVEELNPFNPKEQAPEPPKPFIEPTPFNPDADMPFGNALDAPLG